MTQSDAAGVTECVVTTAIPPRRDHDALAASLAPLGATRRELAARFNGLTAYLRSPAKGIWTATDGHTEQDDVVMVEVVAETFDRAWWRTYSAALAERFHQKTIHVRAMRIEMVDDSDGREQVP